MYCQESLMYTDNYIGKCGSIIAIVHAPSNCVSARVWPCMLELYIYNNKYEFTACALSIDQYYGCVHVMCICMCVQVHTCMHMILSYILHNWNNYQRDNHCNYIAREYMKRKEKI